MAITRLWQAGLESNGSGSISEFSSIVGTSPSLSGTAKTGAYSMSPSGTLTGYGFVTIPPTRQIEFAFHWKCNAVSPTGGSIIVRSATADLVAVRPSSINLILKVAASDVDTEAGATPTSDFAHFGISVKIHATLGWVKVYKDGVEILSATGNTGNTDIVGVEFGNSNNCGMSAFFDDLYINDTTGEAAPAVVPDLRFAYITPNGNGNYSQCTGSDTNKTDNYLLVDEQPHTSDTDYVAALAADERDTYAMNTTTIPVGFGMTALIPYAYARKTDAAVATLIANTIRCGTTNADGADQSLPSSYGNPLWTRYVKQADGTTSWDQAGLDGVEVGHVGRGTF